ncbi:MAG: mitochondrial fission ELM1 family protein [Alphaproteobacteria bacterium]|nr:mitochondrial fission ELM1 family protein [Alphaproteobacteria bacterium]
MDNQCLGLADALKTTPVVKRIVLRTPWKQLAPYWRMNLNYALSRESDSLAPPWPDLVIAAGRAGGTAALLLKQRARKQRHPLVTVYIQNPFIDPRHFDLVAVPRHDNVWGDNVVTTRGSINRITPALLTREKEIFRQMFEPLPSPRIAVCIGGRNAVYDFEEEDMTTLAAQLVELAEQTQGSLMITTSRRTGEKNLSILRDALEQTSLSLAGGPQGPTRQSQHILWTGQGPNPYCAMLAWADAVLVTADSVNMISEACTTGLPVHVIPLKGGSPKFRRFHQSLRDDGLTRPFQGKLEHWSYNPLQDAELVAARVRALLETITS